MLDDNLIDKLEKKYLGCRVKENAELSDEELLEKRGAVGSGRDRTVVCEIMSIYVDTDEDDCIKAVSVRFHTVCSGDPGIGEEDPGDYFSFDVCFRAAVRFIEGILADGSAEAGEGENEDDPDEEIDRNDYADYPFAMEAVNGEIIGLSDEVQEKIAEYLAEICDISMEELADWLDAEVNSETDSEDDTDGEEDDDIRDTLDDYGIDALEELLPVADGEFVFSGIDFPGSRHGPEVKYILEEMGYELTEIFSAGPHGYDPNGVYYLEEI